jgi:hypothetical protein
MCEGRASKVHAARFPVAGRADAGARSGSLRGRSDQLNRDDQSRQAPRLLPGYPVQVNGEVLPPRGIGLIVATDTDRKLLHGKVAVPPLPPPWPDGSHGGWLIGSSPAHSPVFETLWFRVSDTMYVADAKIGWKATGAAQKALGRIIRSIKAARDNH